MGDEQKIYIHPKKPGSRRYYSHGCRCSECKTALSVYRKELRERKKDDDSPASDL